MRFPEMHPLIVLKGNIAHPQSDTRDHSVHLVSQQQSVLVTLNQEHNLSVMTEGFVELTWAEQIFSTWIIPYPHHHRVTQVTPHGGWILRTKIICDWWYLEDRRLFFSIFPVSKEETRF